MGSTRLDRLMDFVRGPDLVLGVVWLGLTVLVIVLLVLMYTRWGSLNVLRKCLALSVAAHLLLGVYSTTVYVAPAMPFLRDPVIRVSLSEKSSEPRSLGKAADGAKLPSGKLAADSRPWETYSSDAGPALVPVDSPRMPSRDLPQPERSPMLVSGDLVGMPSLTERPLVAVPAPNAASMPPSNSPLPQPQASTRIEAIQAPPAQSRAGARAAVGGGPGVERLMPIERGARSPSRDSNPGMPSSLLERPLAMPRLSESHRSPDATPSAAILGDAGQAKPAAKPAEAVPASSGVAPQGTPNSDAASPHSSAATMDPPAVASATSRLKPPSMVDPETAGSAGQGQGNQPGAGGSGASLGPAQLPGGMQGRSDYRVPELYRMRVAPNRSQLSERAGATPELEAAVKAGLKWTADNQERDGRWVAKRHGGGREIMEAGRDRQAAGAQADTGISALAILAFAASGNTHREGSHKATVRRGLDFLLSVQGEDGNLGGDGQLYEFMYCHGMATLALSELAGMTGDEKLRRPLARAVSYTLAAQDPNGGGWRYRAREAGDTSQFGWQIMALKSASMAGIDIPQRTWQGASRFLESVSGGRHQGLASYRPGEEFTRPMTAEALACRLFLGLSSDSATAREAGDHLLKDLPGEGNANLYYWYYGSIAMYQLQGDYWKRWSGAMRQTLLASQRTSGELAGSWDPTTRWDGYGGRVYSTALATLCLEAHYRFLPLNAVGKTASEASAGQ